MPNKAANFTTPYHPLPLQTIVVSEGQTKTIVRRWNSQLARACRFCTDCHAIHGHDGQALCAVVVTGDLDPSAAPTFRDRSP